MPDIDYFVQMAYASNPLREPVLRSVIEALLLPSGSRGLDVGCGIGLQALLLAEAVGPAGHVTGLDLSPEFLVFAKDIVQKAGLSERITFRKGDVSRLPFDNDTFDWAWSADCVGYAPMEPLPLVKELARVVRPGGPAGSAAEAVPPGASVAAGQAKGGRLSGRHDSPLRITKHWQASYLLQENGGNNHV